MEKRNEYVMPCIDIVIREVFSPILAASNEDEWTGDQFGKEVGFDDDFFDKNFLPSEFNKCLEK